MSGYIVNRNLLERVFGPDRVKDSYPGNYEIVFPEKYISFFIAQGNDKYPDDVILRNVICEDCDGAGPTPEYCEMLDFTTEKSFIKSIRKALEAWQDEMRKLVKENQDILRPWGYTDDQLTENALSWGITPENLDEYLKNLDTEERFA